MIEKPLKPAEFAEKKILEAILDSTYQPGDTLPAERVLAGLIGVTRPTLRETLQRLSKEGWVTIAHGKPTRVNDYLANGGLGILSSLARYGRHLSTGMVSHLLEVRTTMFPDIAQKALANKSSMILEYLKHSKTLKDRPDAYAEYDWGLQMLMVKATDNPVFNMIFNDFLPLYGILGEMYFQQKESRAASLAYYEDLTRAVEQNNMDVRIIVEKIMIRSQKIWQKMG
ncbi:MAG: fatty acid metabolism transcriptional regulator FadR [Proteobacteria bacterium]|nr:fatty acid metabolism transcriptional regulator FadR [Pseudomonadota bacterium]MBU1584849.1 fatty acid metabolism transcriptional regulator FadR [Pseudomonadota bacterium]MBU2453758.1 fatty acid metabolism transcriptional regulator FadR [Pseudomonadota bacterium]MBU2628814.1 fatty acid metabolism transcriptional regulator FadR [Pseudomonadota bacterium]